MTCDTTVTALFVRPLIYRSSRIRWIVNDRANLSKFDDGARSKRQRDNSRGGKSRDRVPVYSARTRSRILPSHFSYQKLKSTAVPARVFRLSRASIDSGPAGESKVSSGTDRASGTRGVPFENVAERGGSWRRVRSRENDFSVGAARGKAASPPPDPFPLLRAFLSGTRAREEGDAVTTSLIRLECCVSLSAAATALLLSRGRVHPPRSGPVARPTWNMTRSRRFFSYQRARARARNARRIADKRDSFRSLCLALAHNVRLTREKRALFPNFLFLFFFFFLCMVKVEEANVLVTYGYVGQ